MMRRLAPYLLSLAALVLMNSPALAQVGNVSLEGTWRIHAKDQLAHLVVFGIAVMQKTETAGFFIGLMNMIAVTAKSPSNWATEEIKVQERGNKITVFATIVRADMSYPPMISFYMSLITTIYGVFWYLVVVKMSLRPSLDINRRPAVVRFI